MTQGYKVLLVGCGQLGTRHLQAVAQLPDIAEVHVIDSSEASLELGRTRLAEVGGAATPGVEYHWHASPDESAAEPDLCIVATQSAGRGELVMRLADSLGAQTFLIEKVVTRSVREYEELMSFADSKQLSVWVNCKTRTYGIHKHIKSLLPSGQPLFLSDVGGNHGLGNNGVHAADLFSFYTGGERIHVKGGRVDEMLHPSKRGGDVFDLSGTLLGATDGGSDFCLSFAGSNTAPDVVTIAAPGARFVVDHFGKSAWASLESEGWTWTQVPIDEDWTVSHMTKAFASDILHGKKCELPTLKETFPAHEFVLTALLPHFNRLLGKDDDVCPIT
ncbi:MAG: Gfo/Idh/MocA family oxidoreductase [Coriobacteriia bacterium]